MSTYNQHKVKTEVTTNNYIDRESGELLDQSTDVKHTKILVTSEEQFAFVYSDIISAMEGLSTPTKALLTYISLKANINTNEITLVKHKIEELSAEAGIAVSTIKKSITDLVKKSILIKQGSGVYLINPKYYWRGTINNRKKSLKYVLELEFRSKI